MITYRPDLFQGSAEWHAARCGLLTASEMRLIITPTLKAASNDKDRCTKGNRSLGLMDPEVSTRKTRLAGGR